MRRKLPLEEGEKIEIRNGGALSTVATGRWRLGEWIKTDRRLFFLQGGDVNFTANLDCLIAIERCQREYSFGTKPCLKIICNGRSGAIPFWFVSGNIRLWQDKLAKSLKGRITEADIVQLAKGLGVESERLVWFLYQRQHATIKELAGEINAGSHMEVLEKIKREINPAAQGLLGRPIFVFRQTWANPFHPTEKVAYSWWFADLVEAPEPFYDIIDEGSFYRIIAEAPEDAEVVVNDGSLAFMNEHGFKNAIELPKDADGIYGNSHYRNGILELRIKKRLFIEGKFE